MVAKAKRQMSHSARGAPAPSEASSQREEALLQSALLGDPEAQHALVRLLNPVIHARSATYLARRRRQGAQVSRSDVEDLVQEVWSALLKDEQASLRRWQPERGASLTTFVGLCAERAIISHFRGGARLGLLEDRVEASALEASCGAEATLEDRVHNTQLLGRVLTQLRARLSKKGRRALELLYIDQLTIEEAERQADMSKGALYTWRREIKSMANEILKDLNQPTAQKRTRS